MSIESTIERTPAEVIKVYIKDLGGENGPVLASAAQDMHRGVNHAFARWRGTMITTGAIPDNNYGDVLNVEKEQKLFNRFCGQLKENGVVLTREQKKEAFKEYLED